MNQSYLAVHRLQTIADTASRISVQSSQLFTTDISRALGQWKIGGDRRETREAVIVRLRQQAVKSTTLTPPQSRHSYQCPIPNTQYPMPNNRAINLERSQGDAAKRSSFTSVAGSPSGNGRLGAIALWEFSHHTYTRG